MKLQFTKIRDVKSPERGTKTSSGIDFFIPFDLTSEDVRITPIASGEKAAVDDVAIVIPAGRGVLIPSGLKVKMEEGEKDYTYDLVLIGKSGVSVKTNLIVGAAVIDNDYRGEFNIHLINPGEDDIIVAKGSKIVQGIIREVKLNDLEEISKEQYESMSDTERGEGGFGSTGA